MSEKPLIAIVDADPMVYEGWEQTLGKDARVLYYPDHLALFKAATQRPQLLGSFACVIIGRYFQDKNIDVCNSSVPESLHTSGAGPIFLNWQGQTERRMHSKKIAGKIMQRFGVKWSTLRSRILKYERTHNVAKLPRSLKKGNAGEAQIYEQKYLHEHNITDRCRALLRDMATHANGEHRRRMEHYANHEPSRGVELLEAIYMRLVTDHTPPESCPSRYINTSPVIAKKILETALYQHRKSLH
ncbi:MAG: hypothetical protein OXT67_07610 [Zetaproteobacteria bacterium]|nr:hypothetical protein [Zetaproteobacteria bacterium]